MNKLISMFLLLAAGVGLAQAQAPAAAPMLSPAPANAEVYLSEEATRLGSAALLLKTHTQGANASSDLYYLVKPLFPKGPMRRTITLTHSKGRDVVPVEPLGCRPNSSCFCATGCSQAFHLDEAFEDALRHLPVFQGTDRSLPLPLVDVVAIGALYGGFSGFSHLFLRIVAGEYKDAIDAT